METKLSVIIPTYNGESKISRTIRALENQTYLPFEVIVIVDGSNDDTLNVLESLNPRFSLKWKYQNNAGRSITRNNGAEMATSDLLFFVDDDIELIPESIELHIEGFNKFPNSIITGEIKENHLNPTEFTKFKNHITGNWNMALGQDFITLSEKTLFLTAANMLVSKTTFNKLGGFASDLKDGEDYDLAVRAHNLKTPVIYSPKNIGYHISYITFKQYIIRQREYIESYNELLKLRNTNRTSDLYMKYKSKRSWYKNIFYFFIPVRTVKWMDENKFIFLPSRIRFGLYSRVISALSTYYPKRNL